MEFGLLMADIPVYVSGKFKMYIFQIALVISENVCIAFLYVLSIGVPAALLYPGRLEFGDIVSSDSPVWYLLLSHYPFASTGFGCFLIILVFGFSCTNCIFAILGLGFAGTDCLFTILGLGFAGTDCFFTILGLGFGDTDCFSLSLVLGTDLEFCF